MELQAEKREIWGPRKKNEEAGANEITDLWFFKYQIKLHLKISTTIRLEQLLNKTDLVF